MSTITAETTEREINAPVMAAQAAIAKKIGEGYVDSSVLTRMVNDVAYAEGVAEVRYAAAAMVARGVEPAAIRDSLFRMVLTGADDQWSGRGNDNRRAKADGKRREVENLCTFGGQFSTTAVA